MRSTIHFAIATLVLQGVACTPTSSPTRSGQRVAAGEARLVATGTGPLRTGHAAALLGDGRVLLAGGAVGGTATRSAQIFDPTTGQLTSTGDLTVARVDAAATVLPDGRVLIAGGDDGAGTALASADLYDPVAGTFGAAGALTTGPRTHHTATRVGSRVVVIGGRNGSAALDTVEVYTPAAGAAGSWASLASLGTARSHHTATLLGDGRILVAGGEDAAGTPLAAELYDPSGAGSTAAVAMTPRTRHVAALLTNGDVLVAFGAGAGATELDSWTIFDGSSFGADQSVLPALTARVDATATVLPDGRVVVAGGTSGGAASNATDVFDAAGGNPSSAGYLKTARGHHAATLLPSGRVLLSGGGLGSVELLDRSNDGWTTLTPTGYLARSGHTSTLLTKGALAGQVLVVAGGVPGRPAYDKSCQLYNPATRGLTSAPDLANARAFHTATVLMDGTVLVTGGNTGTDSRNDAEIYDGTSWKSVTAKMTAARSNHTATLLANGKVLLTGGTDGSGGALSSAETYDPVLHTFTATAGGMSTPRAYHVASTLPDGRVLVAGGVGTSSAEIYDPTADAFTASGLAMSSVRAHFTASALADGRVLVVGGTNGSVELGSADLFGGAFAGISGLLPTARLDHAAALLAGGEPLVVGGQDAGGYMASAERYEPASEAFLPLSPLHDARDWLTATQLPTGEILAWGGDDGTRAGPDPEQYDPFSLGASVTRPDITTSLTSGVPDGYLNLTTSGFFTGGVGSSGEVRSADVNQPVFVVARQDGDGVAFARTASFTATTARVQLPHAAPSGWWWIRAIVGGVPGKAVPFRMLDPFRLMPTTPSVPPRGSLAFTATGGNAASYTWSLIASGSHDATDAPALPAVDTTSGAYQAGADPGTDTVECADADGNTVTTDVTVGPRIAIAPASPWGAPPRGTIGFSATGGCDPAVYGAVCTGYTWSFVTNRSGGTLTPAGAYTAGPTGGVADDIQVVDNLGNHAEASITVTTPILIDPTTASVTPLGTASFTVSGGFASAGYTWSLSTNASGGSIDASGHYTAGRTGSVTDVVRVGDTLGSYAEATITVGPGVSLTPASPSLPPRGARAFSATGGNDTFTGCTGGSCWTIVDNRSGGTIDAAGNYAAGPTPNVTDVVQVQDTLGNLATTSVTVGPGITITPVDAGAYPGQTVTLTATGGSGTGFTWQLTTVRSGGGAIAPGTTAGTAVYTAGTVRGATDIVVVTDDLGNTATTDVAVWPDWQPAGSGCSSGGGGGGALGLLLVALFLALRARPRRVAVPVRAARRLGAGLVLLLAASSAQAQVPPVSQSFVVERFQPAGGAYDVLGVQSAQTAGHLQGTFRLTLNYASRPLVLSAPGMDKVALLKSQTNADLSASLGLLDWAEVSLAVPFMLSQSREQDRFLPPDLRQSVAKSGLGDVRLTPRARLLEWGKLRLGVSAPIGLPLGNKKAFLGQGGITVNPTGLAEVDGVGPARLLFNLGAILRPERKLVDLTVGNAITFGAGVEYPFQLGDSRLAAVATFAGESGMKSSAAARPMELLAGARWASPSGLQVGLGGGPGIGKGYGTPQYRVFLELGYTTAGVDRLQEKEKPKEEPKAEPPKPEEPKVEPPKPEEPKAEPKAEEPKAEAKAEPKIEEPKAEPKPEPKSDELAPRAEDVILRIDAHVYFDFNKKDLKEEFKPLLRRVARRIMAEPRMRVIRIEGHADDLGPPDYNLWLSEERARSVKTFLEKCGVPASRFSVVGYGKTKPTKPGRTSDDRAKNRRVEFSVQEY